MMRGSQRIVIWIGLGVFALSSARSAIADDPPDLIPHAQKKPPGRPLSPEPSKLATADPK